MRDYSNDGSVERAPQWKAKTLNYLSQIALIYNRSTNYLLRAYISQLFSAVTSNLGVEGNEKVDESARYYS